MLRDRRKLACPLRRRCDLYREDVQNEEDAPRVDYDCARLSGDAADQFDDYATGGDADEDADAAFRSWLHGTVEVSWAMQHRRLDCSGPKERRARATSAASPYPAIDEVLDDAYPGRSLSPLPLLRAVSRQGSNYPVRVDGDADDGSYDAFPYSQPTDRCLVVS